MRVLGYFKWVSVNKKRQLEYDKSLPTVGLLVLGLLCPGMIVASLRPYCGKETEFAGITLRCAAEISGVVIKYEILICYLFLFFFGCTKVCFVSPGQ